MRYASTGRMELWFGASSAAPLRGFGQATPRGRRAAALRRDAVPVSPRSHAPMAGDIPWDSSRNRGLAVTTTVFVAERSRSHVLVSDVEAYSFTLSKAGDGDG